MKHFTILIFAALVFSSCTYKDNHTNDDPLPSWNDGASKQAIIDFILSTTNAESKDFIPVEDRIAVFDNDGTLWSEQPLYFQLIFTIDRIKALAPEHPEWKDEQPFKAILEGDIYTALSGGEEALFKLFIATHAGMTTSEFDQTVKEWINTAHHPKTDKLYKEMVYQPMLEVLDYLRDNGFKTFIVSGGGIEFMRPWTQEVYGIPAEQVVGSSLKVKFELKNGSLQLVKMPEMNFVNDKEGKPVGIYYHIGKQPVAAFGNSDGDLAMLQYTSEGEGKRLIVYIHHTDSIREWAYDRESHIGRLDKGLDEATANGWTVVDMKKEWKVIFPD